MGHVWWNRHVAPDRNSVLDGAQAERLIPLLRKVAHLNPLPLEERIKMRVVEQCQ